MEGLHAVERLIRQHLVMVEQGEALVVSRMDAPNRAILCAPQVREAFETSSVQLFLFGKPSLANQVLI